MPLDWIHALEGGVLIGLAAALFLLFNGRVLGVSGIVSGLFKPHPERWRIAFLKGVFLTAIVIRLLVPDAFSIVIPTSTIQLIIAGLLVGIGTTLGNGCTSGHGVCGIGRISPRSLLATLTFMALGMLTVGVWRDWGNL